MTCILSRLAPQRSLQAPSGQEPVYATAGRRKNLELRKSGKRQHKTRFLSSRYAQETRKFFNILAVQLRLVS